jgi:GNAT superfamily N-acetyltransferase
MTPRGQPDAHPNTPAATPAGNGSASARPLVVVRRLTEADAIPPITALLHRAYARQVSLGLRPLAARQDDDVTRRRCASGECYLAFGEEDSGRPIGVIILNENEPDEGPPWFMRPGVASFSQLAVDPEMQGRGIGQMLLAKVESRAAEAGNQELGLSMAEPDDQLRDFYKRRGYRIVGTWKWPYTNYLSLIMSKTVG